MIDTVLFDMDGLLTNTEYLWFESTIKYFEQNNIQIEKEFVKKNMGQRCDLIKLAFENKFPNLNWQEYFDFTSCEILKNASSEKFLKKGCIEILEFCKQNKIKTALVSGSDNKRIEAYINASKLKFEYFDVIVAGNQIKNSKPNPEGFERALDILKSKTYKTIVLEDSLAGIKAGFLSGCKTILIPDMVEISENNIRFAYKKLDSLLDVIDLIKKENKM